MSSIEALRKLIREEVTKVIRQELPKILNESFESKIDYKKNLQNEIKKSSVPLTLNEEMKRPAVNFGNSSPLAAMLNETALSMTTEDVMGFNGNFPTQTEATVGNVDSMINNANKSSNLEMVEINTVPDFSGVMKMYKEKGMI
jgi:hypothetical protein